MRGTLSGKKAVVTGAARGLGAALVEQLAREGCDVAGWDMNVEGLKETLGRVREMTGQNLIAQSVNVGDPDIVRDAIDHTVKCIGGVDIMICNAGVVISGDSLTFSINDWQKVMAVNLRGYFICAREAARIMLAQGKGGSIIQINSKSGKKGSFKNCAYAASKFGGIGVTQSLALEFAEDHIRVNAVCPGNLLDSPLWTESLFKQYAENQGITEEEVRQKYIDQVPMKRTCTYDDISSVVMFLASDAASYMTGQAINVTGGQEMR